MISEILGYFSNLNFKILLRFTLHNPLVTTLFSFSGLSLVELEEYYSEKLCTSESVQLCNDNPII